MAETTGKQGLESCVQKGVEHMSMYVLPLSLPVKDLKDRKT